jgi:hypothetical protein
MQKVRRQAFLRLPGGIALRPLVGRVVSGSMPPLIGVLSTVRSRYWFTIGRQGVFSLTGWAPQIHARFHVTGATQVPDGRPTPFAYGTITLCGPAFQQCSARSWFGNSLPLKAARPYNPTRTNPDGLGCSPFARRYSGNRFCFLFLQVLRCFSSLGWLGNPGIKACLAAPPGLSQPATPLLLAPRHPPRALSSLAASVPLSACQRIITAELSTASLCAGLTGEDGHPCGWLPATRRCLHGSQATSE